MKAIKGVYKKIGTVELIESIEVPDDVEVLVIFPEEKVARNEAITLPHLMESQEQTFIYNRLKVKLKENYLNLKNRTKQQKKEDFERISEKIAENLPFNSWEEMDRALKGDSYGLSGH